MDNINIAISVFVVLLLENITDVKGDSRTIVEKVIETIKSDLSTISNEERNTMVKVLKLLRRMNKVLDKGDNLDNDKLIREFTTILVTIDNEEDYIGFIKSEVYNAIKKGNKQRADIILKYRGELIHYNHIHTIENINNTLGKYIKRGESDKAYKFFMNNISEFEDIGTESGDTKAILNEFMFEDIGSQKEALEKLNQKSTRIKTGLTYLNDVSQGGPTAGECIILGALSFNNKTGTVVSATCGVPILNDFRDRVPEGITPLILHLSFEDSFMIVLKRYYETLYMTYNNKYPDYEKLTAVEMAEYVQEKMCVNGNKFLIACVDPTLWGYQDMFRYIKKIENGGYKIVWITNDYLDKLGGDGLDKKGPTGSDKKELLRRSRNFFAKKKCTFLSPWQFNSTLNKRIEEGLADSEVVKYAAGKSMYQGNSTLDTDIDLEIGQHVVPQGPDTFVSLMRGKHRGADFLPIKDRFGVYKFPPVGPIACDAITGKKAYKKSYEAFGGNSNNDVDDLF